MNRIAEASVPAPSTVNASVPDRIDLVARMALERDRAKRYPNAASMQKDLSRLLGEFGGNVTSTDIGGFLHRLFKKEMEAEKEASQSMRRLVVDVAKIEAAAQEGATLNAQDPIDRNTEPRPAAKALPAPAFSPANRALLGVVATLVAVATVAVAVVVGGSLGGGVAPAPSPPAPTAVAVQPTAEPTPSAADSATPIETLPAVATESVGDPTPFPAEATPAATPEATAAPTQVAVRTPRPAVNGTPARLPAPKATAAAAAAKPTGLLKVDSQPWGEIYVDGKSTGRQTPAFDLKLPAGKHKIRLVNPVQKLETEFEVEILADGVVKKVVKLVPSLR